jgi:hypothetical protein
MAQSGAGAEITALAESMQAYACATRQFLKKDLTSVSEITENTISSADCDRTLEQCIYGLNVNWFHSVIVTANKIHKELVSGSSKYIFYRGGKIPGEVYGEFGRFRKSSGISGNDKWNPADIWMVKESFNFVGNHPSLEDYNKYMYDEFNGGNLIGISLKLVPRGDVHSKIFNDGKPLVAEFTGIKLGLDMFSSKDIYIKFKSENKDGEIQFRNFSSRAQPSSWQGEIKGKSSAGGKIGGGIVITSAVESGVSKTKLTIPSAFSSQIVNPSKTTITKFATMFKELSGSKETLTNLVNKTIICQKEDNVWWMSKYLGVSFVYVILNEGKQDDVTKWLFSYGSSATKNSSIFIKYS